MEGDSNGLAGGLDIANSTEKWRLRKLTPKLNQTLIGNSEIITVF